MKKVIDRSNLPTDYPVTGTIAFALGLDRINAPGWLWGVWGTLWAIGWIITIVMQFVQKQTKLKELE